jgi:predicted branched-subunit amino acid permease
VIFSAGLYPYFARHSLGRRLLLGYTTTDVGFAVSLQRWTAATANMPGDEGDRGDAGEDALVGTRRVWFFLGIAAGSWIAWQSLSIAGIFLAAQVPATWGLDFAAVLALIALTVPMVNSRPNAVGALVAGLVAVAAAGLPLKLGLVVAVIAGIVAALATEIALERGSAAT